MPLTPSHAAAALLLRRIDPRLPFSALVVGTVAPDFEYILRLAPRGSFAHSLPGLLLFCLPVSFVVWLIHDRVVWPATTGLLPCGIAAKLRDQPSVNTAWVLLALLLGALSHIVWDAFTHRTGFFVRHFAPLQALVLPESTGDLRVYSVLQHGSTLVGALFLVFAVIYWIRRQPPAARRYAPGQASRFTRVVMFLLLSAMAGATLNAIRVLDRGSALALGYAAVGAMTGFALALLAYSLLVLRPAV